MNKLLVLPKETVENSLKTIEGLIAKISMEIPMLTSSINKAISKYGKAEKENAYHAVNVPLLIRISLIDILILYKHFLSTKSTIEQNLFARLIYAQLYEFIEDVPEILGGQYRQHLVKMPLGKLLIEDLNKVTKIINGFKKNNHEKFQHIRNNISSHKHKDGILQIELMDVLDFNFVMVAYMQLVPFIVEYYQFENRIEKVRNITINQKGKQYSRYKGRSN